jgi:hypothetical protein
VYGDRKGDRHEWHELKGIFRSYSWEYATFLKVFLFDPILKFMPFGTGMFNYYKLNMPVPNGINLRAFSVATAGNTPRF